MSCGARSMTSCQSSTLESRTRSGFASTRSRKVSPSVRRVVEQVLAQQRDVGGTAVLVAHRVDHQVDVAQTERAVEAVRERDHLDVDLGVVDAEHLGAHLPVLAVAALLRALVAEVRRDVPDLPGHRRAVLHEGPHDRRGALGAQRDAAAALVLEVVHLLAHDVGGLTDPLEHLEVLEDGREHQAEAVAGRALREGRHERDPAVGLGREDVVGADRGTEPRLVHGRLLGHGRIVPGRLSPVPQLPCRGPVGLRSWRGRGAPGTRRRRCRRA